MTTKSVIRDILMTTSGVSVFTLIALAPVLAYASDVTPQSSAAAVQSVEMSAEFRGNFEGRSKHITSGDVSIVKTASGYNLILGDNFFLDGAPDPVIGFGHDDTFDETTIFTKLEKKEGRQTYGLPEGFTPNNYSQIYVWCEKFSVPLGVATLT